LREVKENPGGVASPATGPVSDPGYITVIRGPLEYDEISLAGDQFTVICKDDTIFFFVKNLMTGISQPEENYVFTVSLDQSDFLFRKVAGNNADFHSHYVAVLRARIAGDV
jgi:hypothetical protein